jgi:hypothetical protein
MKKIFLSTILVLTSALLFIAFTARLAVAHDPRTTAKTFAHHLTIDGLGNFAVTYKGMHFNETAYKRFQTDAAIRNRVNTGVWNQLGSANVDFDVTIADQALSKGKYDFGLNIEENEGFSLLFKKQDKSVKIPLTVTTDATGVPYLSFVIMPTEKPDTYVIEGRGGKYRGVATMKVPGMAEHAHPVEKK